MLHRYADRRGISYREALKEPWQEVERAFHIWSLDGERDKLEARRAENDRQ